MISDLPTASIKKLQSNVFKNRLSVICLMLGLAFVTVLGRLWQLQVSRYEKYRELSSVNHTSIEQVVPALRAPIYDRNGNVLAEDRPIYDVSVRPGRLQLAFVDVAAIAELPKKYKESSDHPEAPGQSREARDAEFKELTKSLGNEPFIAELARTLNRDPAEIQAGLFKALESVSRGWSSPLALYPIVSGIDEKTWLGLKAVHEDAFLNNTSASASAPFPGLACTVSVQRYYPHGNLACFVLGTLGELSAEDEDQLRHDGVLMDNAVARERHWANLLESMDDDTAARLQNILRVDPRDLDDLGKLYAAMSKLRPQELDALAAQGLVDPVRWMQRPLRVKLNECESLWLGVGLPTGAGKNHLPNLRIGEMGVERIYNNALRCQHGMRVVDLNSDRTELKFRPDSQPQDGNPVALTISMEWQTAVERALKSQEFLGAVVVLDVKSGEVLAMASNPDFDPNLFSPPRTGLERQQRLQAVLSDPRKPLTNRAISEQYPLGSVMKSLVAAVALEKGLVTTTETFNCPGYIVEGGQIFHCDDSHAHGTVNLLKAIRCSCNVTFHQIGARIGVENLGVYAKQILGHRTEIDLPAEASGIYPDRAWRTKTFPNNPAARLWTRGNDFQLAIGQGQMTTTVVQTAVLMAALANGGQVVTPHVWLDAPVPTARSLGISQANIDIVREGLDEVVNVGRPGERGTAYSPFHEHGPELAVRVAGKTSTAEHRHGATPHAWFAGYAPADHPQVAFAIILEEAGHGGKMAAPVAYEFLKEIYGTRNAPKRNPGGPEPTANLDSQDDQFTAKVREPEAEAEKVFSTAAHQTRD